MSRFDWHIQIYSPRDICVVKGTAHGQMLQILQQTKAFLMLCNVYNKEEWYDGVLILFSFTTRNHKQQTSRALS